MDLLSATAASSRILQALLASRIDWARRGVELTATPRSCEPEDMRHRFLPKALWTSLLALLATGCAGTIHLSEEQLRLRAGLTEESAAKGLDAYLEPHGDWGMCRLGNPRFFGPGRRIVFQDGVVTFTAFRFVASGGTLITGGGQASFITGSALVPEEQSVNLRRIDNLQVIESMEASAGTCPKVPSSVVIVHPKEGVAFYVPTERSHLDELIALLSYFSPDAKLKSGIGF